MRTSPQQCSRDELRGDVYIGFPATIYKVWVRPSREHLHRMYQPAPSNAESPRFGSEDNPKGYAACENLCLCSSCPLPLPLSHSHTLVQENPYKFRMEKQELEGGLEVLEADLAEAENSVYHLVRSNVELAQVCTSYIHTYIDKSGRHQRSPHPPRQGTS